MDQRGLDIHYWCDTSYPSSKLMVHLSDVGPEKSLVCSFVPEESIKLVQALGSGRAHNAFSTSLGRREIGICCFGRCLDLGSLSHCRAQHGVRLTELGIEYA